MQTKAVIAFREALDAAASGAISKETAFVLISAREAAELEMLMEAACKLRDQVKGRQVSFSKKVFIPLTNLCRDYCGYCTFRKDPGEAGARTMMPDEVISVAEAGARLGCKEALFSLGDRPEALFPEMRATLKKLGHRSTLSYVAEMSAKVMADTGLLPHVNAGLVGRTDIETLCHSSPSMGLMLESASDRLALPGMPHANAPDKRPSLRIKVIEEAGRQKVPFTTGILIGIGETLVERVEALFAIRGLHERYGHIQEVIIQNFRAKRGTAMEDHSEPVRSDLKRTIATARLILGNMNVQAPPNLSDQAYSSLLGAGINDWGGISPLTPDHINPEKPWPHIEDLRRQTERRGLKLRERLSVYPEYVFRSDFISPPAAERLKVLAGEDGYAAIA